MRRQDNTLLKKADRAKRRVRLVGKGTEGGEKSRERNFGATEKFGRRNVLAIFFYLSHTHTAVAGHRGLVSRVVRTFLSWLTLKTRPGLCRILVSLNPNPNIRQVPDRFRVIHYF